MRETGEVRAILNSTPSEKIVKKYKRHRVFVLFCFFRSFCRMIIAIDF